MAFKMKSGNKTVFKNMGSSPAKQTTEDTKLVGKGETDADLVYEQMHNKKLQAQLEALKASKDNSEKDRSDRILSGEATDEEFLNLKNPEINQEMLEKWRWTSNNSVFVQDGDDYSKLAEYTAKNGEPGYFWLDTARQYSRLSDTPDNKDAIVEGANPC